MKIDFKICYDLCCKYESGEGLAADITNANSARIIIFVRSDEHAVKTCICIPCQTHICTASLTCLNQKGGEVFYVENFTNIRD